MMFMTKKKHKDIVGKLEKNVAQLRDMLAKIEPFAEVGIKCAQQSLRGYKWIDLSYWPQSVFFNNFVKFFENSEGNTSDKLAKTLAHIHQKTNYYIGGMIENKKNTLGKLQDVTKVSPYSGSIDNKQEQK